VTVNEAPPPEMPDDDLPQLIDVAQQMRPEVSAAESGVRIARLNRRLAAKELAPSIALTGQYTRQTAAGFSGDEYSWQIGVVAEKPILDGGVKRGKITSAEARVREAELQLQEAQEQVALEVVQAWLSVEEAQERIATAEQGLVEARERRRMAQLRYREGIAAGIEVIDADTALAAAEASLVNAEYDRQLAVTQLRTALAITGTPRQEGETQ
jgi:outer membrane protein